ncbi:MAG TPA: hypothetical protein VK750_01990 [Cytophagaceae bacterium]|jgi:hypothetical protein|nr:hypothetical protein [Cytophagaceae bacterium]
MEKETKIGLFVGAVVLGIGTTYLLKLKRLSEQLEIVTKVNIHKVGLAGLQLRVDVMMKNPTGGSMKVKFPFVKMLYKDTVFATSEVKDQDYVIPKFGEQQLDPIYVSLPFMQMATTTPDMLKEYQKSGKFPIVVKTITTINNNLPYTKMDTISV